MTIESSDGAPWPDLRDFRRTVEATYLRMLIFRHAGNIARLARAIERDRADVTRLIKARGLVPDLGRARRLRTHRDQGVSEQTSQCGWGPDGLVVAHTHEPFRGGNPNASDGPAREEARRKSGEAHVASAPIEEAATGSRDQGSARGPVGASPTRRANAARALDALERHPIRRRPK